MRRIAVALLVTLGVACRSHGAPVAGGDAGAVPAAALTGQAAVLPHVTANPALASYMAARMSGPPPQPPTLKAPPKTPPVDPYVQRCIAYDYGAEGWTGLQACLRGADVPAQSPDAGHKLGAVRPNPVCPAKLVGDWHFSPSGDNNNTCVDSGHPCKDPIEVESRMGCGGNPDDRPFFTAGTHWHSHGDMAESSAFRIDPLITETNAAFGVFDITCDSTQVASGTLGTVTPKLRTRTYSAGSTTPALTIDLGASAASWYGLQIIDTARGNALGWVDSIFTGNRALIDQPIDPGGGTETDTFTTGDALTIQRPGKLWLLEEKATCGGQPCAGLYPLFGLYPKIINCWIPDSPLSAGQITHLENVVVQNSRIDSAIDSKVSHFYNTMITKSPANISLSSFHAGSISNANALSSTGGGIPIGGPMGNMGEGSWLLQDVQVHGSLIIFGDGVVSGDFIYCDNADGETAPVPWNIVGATSPIGLDSPHWYGQCSLLTQWGGLLTFLETGSATNIFGPQIQLLTTVGGGNAIAMDTSHREIQFSVEAMSQANLNSAPFNGVAINDNMNGGYVNWSRAAELPGQPEIVWNTDNISGLTGGCATGVPILSGATKTLTCSGAAANYCAANQLVIGSGSAVRICSTTPSNNQWAEFIAANPPSSLTGLLHWVEQDVGLTLSGSNVTAWADQSGNGLNMTPGSSPTYNATGGPGGTGRVTFAWTQNLQNATNMTSHGHTRAMWIVARDTASAATGGFPLIFARSDNALKFAFNGPSGRILTDSITFTDTSTYADDGAFHLFEYDYTNSGTPAFYVDGAAQSVSGTAGAETGSAGFLIGNSLSGSGVGFQGDIEEEFTIDHVPNSTERNNMGGYVQGKYGITVAGANIGGWVERTISGDFTIDTNGVATLASVGTPGTCGDATHSCQITFDAKGRETAESNTAISGLGVPAGGTGIATCASGAILQGNGTSPFTCTVIAAHSTLIAENSGVVVGAAPSTSGFVLTSNGASADPTFQAAAGGGTLAGDATGAIGANTVSGLQNKALPSLPGSTQALYYTGAAWSFFSTIDVAAGTGITITGSPTKTISLTSPVSGTLAFSAFNSNSTGANALPGTGTTVLDELSLSFTTTQANQKVDFFGQGSVNFSVANVTGTAAFLTLDGTAVLIVDVMDPGSNQRAPFSMVWSQTVTTAGAHTVKIQVRDISASGGGNANNLSLLANGYTN